MNSKKRPYSVFFSPVILGFIILIFVLAIFKTYFFRPISSLDDNFSSELYINIQKIFAIKNKSMLENKLELLSNIYDKEVQKSLWAYEHEAKRIKYLSNWSSKQKVKFTGIDSHILLNDIHNHNEGYIANILVSTEYKYAYIDEPQKENSFRLGTYHFIDITQKKDTWKIRREWYTDPFADSLDLDEIENERIKDIIIKQKPKGISKLNQRRIDAVKYADKYCGAASLPQYNFQFNDAYTNFNPQGGDCANFASQMLYEGGKFPKNNTWNYSNKSASKAWVNAHAFNDYMIYSGRASLITSGNYADVLRASYKLLPGDYIAYQKKNKITHISVVTGEDSKGYALLNSHNTDRYRVPWDLGWSNNDVKYWLVHVHY